MKNTVNNITPKLIIIFLYLQPILDIIGSLLIKYNLPNYITSLIRFAFVGYLVLYLIITDYKNKKRVLLYIGLVSVAMILHLFIMYNVKGSANFISEFRNTLSTYYLIYVLITFTIIYEKNTFNKKTFRNIFLIYLLLTLIPNLLGIGFKSYYHSKVGSTGWFYSANVVGSILLLLLISSMSVIKKMNKWIILLLALGTIYVFFSIGTKTPVIGLLLIILIYLIYYIYKKIKAKQKRPLIITSISIIIVLVGSIFLLPKTSFYKNLVIHYEYLKKNNISIISKEFLDNMVFSERLTYLENTNKIYKNSPVTQKLFGIGYLELTGKYKGEVKTIEMDYFDIFYKEGIIGFILYFIPFIIIIINYIKSIKLTDFGIEKLSILLLILLLALFQGHILITPAISVFVSILLVLNKEVGENNEYKYQWS